MPLSLRLASALLALAALTPPARGLELAGVPVAHQASQGAFSLTLNGAGVRSFLLFDLYVLALYLPEPERNAQAVLERDAPCEVRLMLLRDVSADRNVDLLKRGLEGNNSPQTLAAIRDQVTAFLDLLRRVGSFPKGSVIRLDYEPGPGTQLWVNERLVGNFAGEAFNRAILRVWLGDHPVQASLKAALLGQG